MDNGNRPGNYSPGLPAQFHWNGNIDVSDHRNGVRDVAYLHERKEGNFVIGNTWGMKWNFGCRHLTCKIMLLIHSQLASKEPTPIAKWCDVSRISTAMACPEGQAA